MVKSAFFILASLPLAAQVTPVPSSESKDTVPAFDSSGAITLPAARLKIDVTYPRGKKERIELTVVYDPKTGHYLWHLMTPYPGDTGLWLEAIKTHRSLAYADPACLMDFSGAAFAKAWVGHADSLDAAVSASVQEIQQGFAANGGNPYVMGYRIVRLSGPITSLDEPVTFMDFACAPLNSWCPPNSTMIVSIAKQGANWRLVLRNRFDVEVVLDQNLDMVSARQLTRPKDERLLF